MKQQFLVTVEWPETLDHIPIPPPDFAALEILKRITPMGGEEVEMSVKPVVIKDARKRVPTGN